MFYTNKDEYELIHEEHRKLSESLDDFLLEFARKDTDSFIKIFNEFMFMDGNYDAIIHEGKVRQVTDTIALTKKHTDRKIDGAIEPIIKSIKRSIIGQTREEIIQNHVKVSKLISRALVTGTIFLINPAIGILKIFITKCLRERLKTKERERIIADLKRELAICEEKIRDADSSGDKKKKYELMRLKNELERSIQRVRAPHLTSA